MDKGEARRLNHTMKPLLLVVVILLLIPAAADAALTDNLEAYWKFDESSGTAADSTANARDLTNNNTIPYVAGKINNASDLESGSSQYFSRTNNFDFTAGTICTWTNIESLANSRAIASTGNGSGTTGFYFDHRLTGSTLRFGFGAGSNEVSSASAVSTGSYLFLCATWSTSNKKLYVAGSNVATNSTSETLGAAGGSIHIGKLVYVSGDYYDGTLDEMGIWSRQLSDAEITSLYNSGTGLSYPFTTSTPKVPDIILISRAPEPIALRDEDVC